MYSLPVRDFLKTVRVISLIIFLQVNFAICAILVTFTTTVYCKLLQGGPKNDTCRTYITLYERYHFFGPPGSIMHIEGLR